MTRPGAYRTYPVTEAELKPTKKRSPAKRGVETFIEVIVPDSHGNHIDLRARDAFLRDLKSLQPHRVIRLGDHTDCGGLFSTHQRTYTNEMAESYEDDIAAENEFLDLSMKAAPGCTEWEQLQGNHEQHCERWAARTYQKRKDAEAYLARNAPEALTRLKERGIRYYKRSEMHQGLAVPGVVRFGKCFFTHGSRAPRHAAMSYAAMFQDNIVHGHTHRAQHVVLRSVTKHAYMAACPGTLAKLQPLYRHTDCTDHTHGYAVRFIARSGRFQYINVPIYNGESLLQAVAA